jgi:NADH:ubiquinone oxidoreductase subunit 5 (subunit L)/multisubunit Na+/H+ antiporter MnhA subunit
LEIASVPVTLIAAAAVAAPFAGALIIGVLRLLDVRASVCAALATLAAASSGLLVAALWAAPEAAALWHVDWIPTAGVGFGVWVDPVGRAVALLVTGIAFLGFLYSTAYVPRSTEGRGPGRQGAYYAYLLVLTGAVLGLCFSADLIQFYLFWEVIDIAAFLLVGLNWRDAGARHSAGVVLLVTTLGGLALFVGIVLIGSAAGTYAIPELLGQADVLAEAPLFGPALLLLVVGATTKAAQIPFHIWLPHSMAAPTPVNALADSAAALAAGLFLLLRFHPVAAQHPVWTTLLTVIGLASAIAGGVLAARELDLKILLAYSTVSQYGFMFALLGIGGSAAPAVAVFFLVQHGILKAGLFFVVGAVGYASGVWRIGGGGDRLWRRLPLLFAVAAVLSVSLAGLPPLGGFWMKESFLHQVVATSSPGLIGLFIMAAALTVAYTLRFFTELFFARAHTAAPVRRVPALMVVVPGVLATLTVVFGVLPGFLADHLAVPAGTAITGRTADLELGFELGPALFASAAALGLGLLAFVWLGRRRILDQLLRPEWSLDRLHRRGVGALLQASRWSIGLQDGQLLRYLTWTLVTLSLLVGFTVLTTDPLSLLSGTPGYASAPPEIDWRMSLLLLLVCAGTLMTLLLTRHVHIVLALGVVGYLIAGVFGMALAPSLGLLQVHVETLVTVLLILPLATIPQEVRARMFTATRQRLSTGRVAIAGGAGAVSAWVSWIAIEQLPPRPIAPWFLEHGRELTGSDDLVAAVLLHFRAMDTLGEIVVFATATAGVLALSHIIRRERQ